MRVRSLLSSLILVAAVLSLGASCNTTEDPVPDDAAYDRQSAEEQTMDEQMDEVDEQINR